MTTIATWNVNSIKARLPNVLAWLKAAQPDVALLQELKCVDDNFPRLEIEELGYNVAVNGQKSYNGVAILSKFPLEDVRRGLPGNDGDDHARYLEATVRGFRVATIYLPNGNPIATEKFTYKLAWMDRLIAHARALLASEQPVVLGGDYNVIPTDADVHDPALWINDALFLPRTREKFQEITHLGLTDAIRALLQEHVLDAGHSYGPGPGDLGINWERNIGVPNYALVEYKAPDNHPVAECPMCAAGEPITSF